MACNLSFKMVKLNAEMPAEKRRIQERGNSRRQQRRTHERTRLE